MNWDMTTHPALKSVANELYDSELLTSQSFRIFICEYLEECVSSIATSSAPSVCLVGVGA